MEATRTNSCAFFEKISIIKKAVIEIACTPVVSVRFPVSLYGRFLGLSTHYRVSIWLKTFVRYLFFYYFYVQILKQARP